MILVDHPCTEHRYSPKQNNRAKKVPSNKTYYIGIKKIISIALLLGVFIPLHSHVRLPKLISNGMVLQRDTPITVWGWASPGENVQVSFKGNTYRTVTDPKGKWSVSIEKQVAGGPYNMTVHGENSIQVNDIMIGDVWLCSGQSNMEISMQRVKPLYESEITKANYPNIRYFEVPKTYNFEKEQTQISGGNWEKVTPETVLHFSAVAYFFAKQLNDRYQVPIGLINSSLGGSPAEAWLSKTALKKFPEHYKVYEKYKDTTYVNHILQSDRKRMIDWYEDLNKNDRGIIESWAKKPAPFFDSWETVNVPGFWADQGKTHTNGVVWYHKKFNLPPNAALSGKLLLGRIVDADSVYINGHFIGNTTYQYPPRRYAVPEGILKSGENLITVKLINERGKGGFVPEKPYQIVLEDIIIPLKGAWKFKLGHAKPPLQPQTFVRWKPGGLFNAMIAPLTPYKIKGVIWYQGESNTGKPSEYGALFSTLIKDWRASWKLGNFPFLYVQLANFMEPSSQPEESNWATLRNEQLKTLDVPNTGMAVTIDIGEWNDIHPLNKEDVGKRLALLARKIAYGEKNITASGPILSSSSVQGNKIVLSFKNVGNGLIAKNGSPLKSFAIAGKDKHFVWAKAKIDGNQIVVWSDQIPNPKYVRYAWGNNPEHANLYNKEGLPASPFQTE